MMDGYQLVALPLGKDLGLNRTTSHGVCTEEGTIRRRALHIQEQDKLNGIPALKHTENIGTHCYSSGIMMAWDAFVAELLLEHLAKAVPHRPQKAVPCQVTEKGCTSSAKHG